MGKLGRSLLKGLKEAADTYAVYEKKPLLERIRLTIYTADLLDPVFNVYYAIRRFFRRVKKLIEFMPVVWRHEDWDHSFVMEFNAYLFKRLYKGVYTEGHHLYRPSEARKLQTVIELCKRLSNDHDYTDAHYDAFRKKYGKDQDEFADHLEEVVMDGVKRTLYSDPVKKRLTPEQYEAYKKEMTQLHKLEDYLYQQDMDLLFKILKKNMKKWWD